MKFNFILREMTHLRYYLPLVAEANKLSIKSCFYLIESKKYNCPFKNMECLISLVKDFNVKLENNLPKELKDFWFLNEDSGLSQIIPITKATSAKIIIMTYQTDFINLYYNYEKYADYIMMPSKNIANFYNLISHKNIFCGITKYDTKIKKDEALQKYNLKNSQKRALVIWPKNRDIRKYPFQIINYLNDLNYQILIKSRKKDLIQTNLIFNYSTCNIDIFYDNWFPHTTQELIEVSDLVINCGSTTIEECVMHEKPIINFDIKPKVNTTHEYLYKYNFCINLKNNLKDMDFNTFLNILNILNKNKDNYEFKKCKKEWLNDNTNSCKMLLDFIL